MEGQENATRFKTKEQSSFGIQSSDGLNVWMIYVVGNDRRKTLINILKESPIHFNSYVFEVLDSIEGKLLKISIEWKTFISIYQTPHW